MRKLQAQTCSYNAAMRLKRKRPNLSEKPSCGSSTSVACGSSGHSACSPRSGQRATCHSTMANTAHTVAACQDTVTVNHTQRQKPQQRSICGFRDQARKSGRIGSESIHAASLQGSLNGDRPTKAVECLVLLVFAGGARLNGNAACFFLPKSSQFVLAVHQCRRPRSSVPAMPTVNARQVQPAPYDKVCPSAVGPPALQPQTRPRWSMPRVSRWRSCILRYAATQSVP